MISSNGRSQSYGNSYTQCACDWRAEGEDRAAAHEPFRTVTLSFSFCPEKSAG